MRIMSAGMHTSFMSGYVVHLIGFLYRKGIHICTEHNGLPLFFSLNGSNEAAVRLILHKRNPQFLKLFFHIRPGLGQFSAQLRNLMKLPAHSDQLFL